MNHGTLLRGGPHEAAAFGAEGGPRMQALMSGSR
jgi:hypothetical protein